MLSSVARPMTRTFLNLFKPTGFTPPGAIFHCMAEASAWARRRGACTWCPLHSPCKCSAWNRVRVLPQMWRGRACSTKPYVSAAQCRAAAPSQKSSSGARAVCWAGAGCGAAATGQAQAAGQRRVAPPAARPRTRQALPRRRWGAAQAASPPGATPQQTTPRSMPGSRRRRARLCRARTAAAAARRLPHAAQRATTRLALLRWLVRIPRSLSAGWGAGAGRRPGRPGLRRRWGCAASWPLGRGQRKGPPARSGTASPAVPAGSFNFGTKFCREVVRYDHLPEGVMQISRLVTGNAYDWHNNYACRRRHAFRKA
jgi:hypothetical protein